MHKTDKYCLLFDKRPIAWDGLILKFLDKDIIKNSKAVSQFSYKVFIDNFVMSTYSVKGFLLLRISWMLLLLISSLLLLIILLFSVIFFKFSLFKVFELEVLSILCLLIFFIFSFLFVVINLFSFSNELFLLFIVFLFLLSLLFILYSLACLLPPKLLSKL